MIEHRVAYSARNFAKSSLSDVTKVRNAGLPNANVTELNGLNIISRIREIVEQSLGHLIIGTTDAPVACSFVFTRPFSN